MRWRMTSTEFRKSTREGRSSTLAALVTGGKPVGVLAYRGREPVGWCSIAPRESYAGLGRYRALPRLDARPVWSIVCFFVDRRERGQGITLGLLKAAVDHARARGARIVEGYPVQPGPRLYTYMGSPATFKKAGFKDVTPKGQARKIVRYVLDGRERRR